MTFFYRKPVILAFLVGLFLCFAPIVSAQSNIWTNQSGEIDENLEKSPTEPGSDIEKIRADDLRESNNPQQFSFANEFGKLDFANLDLEKTVEITKFNKKESNKFIADFRSKHIRGKQIKLAENKELFFIPLRKKSKSFDYPKDIRTSKDGFQWRSAIQQSMLFLAVRHGYALTQPKTREALKGNFFKDYAKSVKSLRGWDDGGRFFTNYIAHPMQGALTGFIYVQNDPKAVRQQFGKSGDYWRSWMKAMAWSAVWSTQFEIGPISQASIGNVGLSGKQTWEDIVVTPTLGTAMLVMEDALDRFVTQRIERKTDNFYVKIFSRMLLSPTRIFANMLRFKTPWYRDRSHFE